MNRLEYAHIVLADLEKNLLDHIKLKKNIEELKKCLNEKDYYIAYDIIDGEVRKPHASEKKYLRGVDWIDELETMVTFPGPYIDNFKAYYKNGSMQRYLITNNIYRKA